MARSRSSSNGRQPARTPEAREDELTSAAYDLAEEQIQSGTASSQVITHFLKAGSRRESMEQMRMRHEIEMMGVKMEQLRAETRREELFAEAIEAMRSYSGLGSGDPREIEAGEDQR